MSRKTSKGKIAFTTVFPEEFQRYLMYELENMRQWNNKIVDGGMIGIRKWTYAIKTSPGSVIEWDGSKIICTSENRYIQLRKGLRIDMANARIEISGSY